jgi:hypothetical protein
MPAIHGGHPSGRRYATLKMAPGHFFCLAGMPASLIRHQKASLRDFHLKGWTRR